MHYADLNIEFAHLYVDEIASEEYSSISENIKYTRDFLQLYATDLSVTLCVLIDDYNNSREDINLEHFLSYLKQNKLAPHYIAWESDMCNLSDELLSQVQGRFIEKEGPELTFRSSSSDLHLSNLRTSYRFKEIFFNQNIREAETNSQSILYSSQRLTSKTNIVLTNQSAGKTFYSCPILAASWALARFGVHPYYTLLSPHLPKNQQPFIAQRLINILNSKYIKVEATVLDLISSNKSRKIRKLCNKIDYIFCGR